MAAKIDPQSLKIGTERGFAEMAKFELAVYDNFRRHLRRSTLAAIVAGIFYFANLDAFFIAFVFIGAFNILGVLLEWSRFRAAGELIVLFKRTFEREGSYITGEERQSAEIVGHLYETFPFNRDFHEVFGKTE